MFDDKIHADRLQGAERAALRLREAEADRLFHVAPSRVMAQFQLALDRGDVLQIIALGRALSRHSALGEKPLHNFCMALLAEGEAAEALRALQHISPSARIYPAILRLRATALAMLGQLQEAQSIALESLALEAGSHGQRLVDRLGRAVELQARAGDSWADADAYVQALSKLDARNVAAEALARAVTSPPAINDASPASAVSVARAALSSLGPARVEDLVSALRQHFPDDQDVLALHLQWLVRAGRTAEARALLPANQALDDAGRNLALAAAEVLDTVGEVERAIALLGALCMQHENDLEPRQALAFCVGRLTKATTPAAYAPGGPRKIFSLFPFYNELTMLKIRLREMAEWVDGFVLVEAAQTFTGVPKPFHFDEFKAAVAAFEPKIHRVTLEAFPECCSVTPWAREFYQRDQAIKGLDGLWGPDDLILVTDVDEIVNRQALDGFEGPFASLRMQTHAFFLNYCAAAGTSAAQRRSGFVCRADVLKEFGSSYLRMAMTPHFKNWRSLPGAGWHLTSIGDAAAITDKCRNYSHQEAAKAGFRIEAVNQARLDAIRAGRPDPAWKRREIDDTFPAYIRENRDELSDLIL